MIVNTLTQWKRVFDAALSSAWVETIAEAIIVANAADLTLAERMTDKQVKESVNVFAMFNVSMAREIGKAYSLLKQETNRG